MDNKKDIGKLFKARFEETEVVPNDSLWHAIAETLDQEKKRRGFYLLFGGLIAVLIFISASYVLFSDSLSTKEIKPIENTVIQEQSNNQDTISSENAVTSQKEIKKDSNTSASKTNTNTSNVQDSIEAKITNETSKTVTNETVKTSSTTTRNNTVINNSYTDNTLSSAKEKHNTIEKTSEEKQLSYKNEADITNKTGETPSTTTRNNTVINSLSKQQSKSKEQINKSVTSNSDVVFNSQQNQTKQTSIFTPKKQSEELLEIDNVISKTNSEKDEISKNELFTKIEEELISKDTLAQTNTSKITKRKVIKKDTNTIKKPESNTLKKYSIFPFTNGSYYTSLRKASAINPALNDIKKSSTFKIGYGVSLVFEIDDKLRLRIGAEHIAIEKSSLEVPISSGDQSTNFYNNITFRRNLSFTSFSNSLAQDQTITLVEELAYFNFTPIEATYTIWEQSQFGVDVIGGINISILGKNKLIAIQQNGSSTLLGSNDNYKRSNFGINIGAGLYYNLNKKFQIRLESHITPRFGVLEEKGDNSPLIIGAKFGVVIKI